jgi:hypothetical protein
MNLSTINKGLFTIFTYLLTNTRTAQLKIAEACSNKNYKVVSET